VARSDFCVVVTEPACEYRVRTDCERLGMRPYVPQARRRWFLPDGVVTTKLVPIFAGVVLLPLPEFDPPTLRSIRHLRRAMTDRGGRPQLFFGAVISALMLHELQREFDDHERSARRSHQQAAAGLGVAPRLPGRHVATSSGDPEPAVGQLVAALSRAQIPGAAVHAI
jgi:hypothetical protein